MVKKAFTMVELVFVIVILGILAAVAIPRLAASRDDASLVKAKSDLSAIRSSISLKRSENILQGKSGSIEKLDGAAANADGASLFGDVLDYGVVAGSGAGSWRKNSDISYSYNLNGTWVEFDYNSTTGHFNCQNPNSKECIELTK
ncbi:MAG: type II secretion system GspH family protein [Sulfurospirillaceae bacterium]|nr:type II secretion system GspH family protein [Sulfurospirillaceae bacterium]MCK9546113.1 type II secretion system GspH family protein [Sulfurospirillaceae bacterium]